MLSVPLHNKKKKNWTVKMAGALKEDEATVRRVYSKLQAVSCPLLESLDLQEAVSMLDLLCVPSPYRIEVLTWMYSSIDPSFDCSKAMRSKDPDALFKEMAVFGQELMLCRADELGLFREDGVSVQRQLQFLEELVSCVVRSKDFETDEMDPLGLLDELFSDRSLPISQLLQPTVDPWPTHMKILQKNTEPSSKPTREDVADVATLLQKTQSALEQLKSKCEFLNSEEQSSAHFSPDLLQITARDLHQMIGAFNSSYETNQCSRDPPVFGKDPEVFQRVHRQLLAVTTEMKMLKEILETSASVKENLNNPRLRQWLPNKEGDPPENQQKDLECFTSLSSLFLHEDADTNSSKQDG